MAAVKAVVFDMDGVLVDSEPFWVRDAVEFFGRHGVDVSFKQAAGVVGLSMRDTNELELSWWNAAKPDEQLTVEEYHDMRWNDPDRPHLCYRDALMPYARYVFEHLCEAGVTVAIASSSSRHAIDRMLSECELAPYVDFRVSGEDFERSKPDPAIYLSALERLDLPVESVVAVEDSTVGIQAAAAAGLRVVARRDARYNFDQTPATWVVGDLLEAYDVIARLR